MNKRPDASSALKFLTILSGISSVILLLVAFYVSAEEEYLAGTFWGIFVGSLVAFAGMFVVTGFHNVLLDIRDQKYEHTALLKSIRDAVDGGKAAAEEAAKEAERLDRWKEKWHRKVEKFIENGSITNDCGTYMHNRIDSRSDIPNNEDEWSSGLLCAFTVAQSNVETSDYEPKNELEVWKEGYLKKIDASLSAGSITQEKAESLRAKVRACTKIPESQK